MADSSSSQYLLHHAQSPQSSSQTSDQAQVMWRDVNIQAIYVSEKGDWTLHSPQNFLESVQVFTVPSILCLVQITTQGVELIRGPSEGVLAVQDMCRFFVDTVICSQDCGVQVVVLTRVRLVVQGAEQLPFCVSMEVAFTGEVASVEGFVEDSWVRR